MIEIPAIEFSEAAGIDGLLKYPVRSEELLTMESLDQSYGFLLDRKVLKTSVKGKLSFGEVRDYAVITQGKRTFGVLDRRLKQNSMEVDLADGEPLHILVENMARINFGPRLVDDRKGIMEKVTIGDQPLTVGIYSGCQ